MVPKFAWLVVVRWILGVGNDPGRVVQQAFRTCAVSQAMLYLVTTCVAAYCRSGNNLNFMHMSCAVAQQDSSSMGGDEPTSGVMHADLQLVNQKHCIATVSIVWNFDLGIHKHSCTRCVRSCPVVSRTKIRMFARRLR